MNENAFGDFAHPHNMITHRNGNIMETNFAGQQTNTHNLSLTATESGWREGRRVDFSICSGKKNGWCQNKIRLQQTLKQTS